MKKILFAYSTNEGQTYKILNTIEHQLKAIAKVDYIDLKNSSNQVIDFEKYDYVLVSSSIRYGKYAKEFYDFVRKNKSQLKSAKAEFMSVNLTARKEGKDDPQTSGYIRKFYKKSQWMPANITMFAGLLAYPKYGLIDKRMIQFIMYLTKGETNISKTVEYTNWAKVELFARKIEKQLI